MNLPIPTSVREIIPTLQAWVRILRQQDAQTLKRNQDYHLGDARIILSAPDGGKWVLEVDNSGNLSTSAYPL